MPDEQGQIWSYSEAALTEAGRRRATELASVLEPVRIDAVYSSDLRRARETAETIAKERVVVCDEDAHRPAILHGRACHPERQRGAWRVGRRASAE